MRELLSEEILKQIKKLINSNKTHFKGYTDFNTISFSCENLYDKLNKSNNLLLDKLEYIDEFNKENTSLKYDEEDNTLNVIIPFKNYKRTHFIFKLENNEIKALNKKDFLLNNIVISKYSNEIKKIYRNHKKYNEMINEVTPVKVNGSTIFKTEIGKNYTAIYTKGFEINRYHKTEEYETIANNYRLKDIITGKEKEIFDNFYIDTRKLPSWVNKEIKNYNLEINEIEDKIKSITNKEELKKLVNDLCKKYGNSEKYIKSKILMVKNKNKEKSYVKVHKNKNID